jgi:pre-mRNA-processing factor 39
MSVQGPSIKVEATKGLENGHAAGEIDEATLRKGEVQYSTYFENHAELPATAQGLAAFL